MGCVEEKDPMTLGEDFQDVPPVRCKLYSGATPWRDARPARPSRGGGLIP